MDSVKSKIESLMAEGKSLEEALDIVLADGTIDEFVMNILQAIYGEEVRGSIVEAIWKGYRLGQSVREDADAGRFKGDSGVGALTNGMFALYVVDSELWCEFVDSQTPPRFELTNGELFYLVGGE